ncbi:hypothetical protein [Leisingera sp. M523]|uniref:hypothetical protein n=1 Tax=Leisingera sp. M523 TaxID=2867013 RepID=UPI0021A6D71F|nr:hypothetical protein [Leisingera sp. M523]UWQ27924.1 hypothetical protein K3557_14225 [Leisingera sp. M523]
MSVLTPNTGTLVAHAISVEQPLVFCAEKTGKIPNYVFCGILELVQSAERRA